MTKINPPAGWFAARILRALPQLARYAAIERADHIAVPSPTGAADRQIVFALEQGEPLLSFGPWHTHASLLGDAFGGGCDQLIEMGASIMRDELVLCIEDDVPDTATLVDLRDPDSLLDEITLPRGAKILRIRSWTGGQDRDVQLG
jgi:hypothetical protein